MKEKVIKMMKEPSIFCRDPLGTLFAQITIFEFSTIHDSITVQWNINVKPDSHDCQHDSRHDVRTRKVSKTRQ